jgi:hypothetical protein
MCCLPEPDFAWTARRKTMINTATNFLHLPQYGVGNGFSDFGPQARVANKNNLDIADDGAEQDGDIRDPSNSQPVGKTKNDVDSSSDMMSMILQIGLMLLMFLANRPGNSANSGGGDSGDIGMGGGGDSMGLGDPQQQSPLGGTALMGLLMMLMNQFGNNGGDAGESGSGESGGGSNGGGVGASPGEGAGQPPAVVAPPQPPVQNAVVQPLQPQPQPQPASAPAAVGEPAPAASPGGNKITYTNDGKSPMHIKFTPNAGQQQIPDLTLKPGETKDVSFPEGWSGNWRSTAGSDKAVSLGEVAFQGGNGLTYYDDSRIEGSNMGQTIEPEGGGRRVGTMENMLAEAPESLLVRDGQGKAVGLKPSTVADQTDPKAVAFLRKYGAEGDFYAFPTDDKATAGTKSNHLNVRMQDFV